MEAHGTAVIPSNNQIIYDQATQCGSPLERPGELPFEDINAFSTDPLSFEEMTSEMLELLDQAFLVSRYANRFSTLYLAQCDELEKQIRRLGSACLTKAVLEQKGLSFPKLGRLSIELLYSMVSFNFRKCVEAYKESRENRCYEPRVPQIICRWYALAEQLIATRAKIDAVHAGRISADDLAEKYNFKIGKPEQLVPEHLKSRQHPAALKKAASLPVSKSVIRNELTRFGSTIPEKQDLPKNPTELFRQMMVKEAVRRNDHQFAEKLKKASAADLRKLMTDMNRSKGGVDPKSREGPTAEVRKKLRDKRKKKR